MARALERRAELAAQALEDNRLAEEELERQRQEKEEEKAAAGDDEEVGMRKKQPSIVRACDLGGVLL